MPGASENMIDYISARIGPYGISKMEHRKLLKDLGLSLPFKVRRLKLHPPNSMGGIVQFDVYPSFINIACCPMKVLGAGNCYGDGDLQALFRRCIPRVFAALGLEVPEWMREIIRRGSYRLMEVHITEHFYLNEYGISEFVRAVEQALQGSYRIERAHRGVGFTIDGRSRRLVVLIYNKMLEFQRKGAKLYLDRIGEANDWQRAFLGLDLAIQRYVAAAGPRVEFRLGDHFFHKNERLTQAANWTPDRAARIYREELAKLKFPPKVDAVWARRRAEIALSPPARRTYLLWARGESWQIAVGTRDTWRTHRAEILARLGVDIDCHPDAVHGRHSVDPSAVFTWGNRVMVTDEVLDTRLGSLNEHVPLLA